MKNRNLELVKNRLDISGKTFVILAVFSVLYLAGCLTLLLPAVRNLALDVGEFLLHRPLTRSMWQGDLFSLWSVLGIILYPLFFFTFFSKNIFPGGCSEKKAYAILAAYIALAVFIIMYQANWTFNDDHEYITTTAINKYVPFYSYITNGRFFPLGHFHYNIPLFLFRLLGINSGLPVGAHYVLIAFFYSVAVVCLFLLFDDIMDSANRSFSLFFACAFFFLGGDFGSIFTQLIFPEAQEIMLFAFFMLMHYKALKTGRKRYYTAAFLSVMYAAYCKEPVFGALIVIALTHWVFNFKNLSKKEKVFYAALVANGILFVILYYVLSFSKAAGFYNEGRVEAHTIQLVISIFRLNPVLIPLFILGFARMAAVILKKDRAHLYHDTLLFAGIAYTFAYILLRLNGGYYFMPSVILSLPSFVFWINYLYQKNRNRALLTFGLLLLLCFFNSIRISSVINTYHERKEFMPYITALLSEHNEGKRFIWYESDNALSDNTFYKAVRGWRKHIENAFLNFQNKSEGKEFFTVYKNGDELILDKNVLFFYPIDNDQNQPMPESLSAFLKKNGFELIADSYGVLIYK